MVYFFQTHTQLLAVLCGLLVGYPFVWVRRERIGVKNPISVLAVCFAFSIASVFSALIFAVIEQYISGVLFPRIGPISVLGVYLICPLLLLLVAKIFRLKISGFLDCFAVYASISLIFMRCNCLISGCCLGTLIPGTEMRYPTRQAEIIFYLLMILWFIHKERKGYVKGTFFPFLMMMYGIVRFILEWFRVADTPSAFHLSHVWAIMAAVIGAVIYFMMIKKSGRNLPEEEA